jgi:hypothetical protein
VANSPVPVVLARAWLAPESLPFARVLVCLLMYSLCFPFAQSNSGDKKGAGEKPQRPLIDDLIFTFLNRKHKNIIDRNLDF